MIEVIHFRDPDDNCAVLLFVDGVRVPDSDWTLADYDPGRGYTAREWAAHHHAEQRTLKSQAAREAGREAFIAGKDSKYVESQAAVR